MSPEYHQAMEAYNKAKMDAKDAADTEQALFRLIVKARNDHIFAHGALWRAHKALQAFPEHQAKVQREEEAMRKADAFPGEEPTR